MKCFLLSALCFIMGVRVVYSQNTSALRRFSVDNIIGCGSDSSPFRINITELFTFPVGTSVQYYFDGFTGLEGEEDSLFFEYSVPGEYYITQFAGIMSSNKLDSLKVTILDPTPPEFEAFNCDANIVRVEITDTNYDQYEVDFGGLATQIMTITSNMDSRFSQTFNFGAGDYTITVTGLVNGSALPSCSSRSINISTIDAIVDPVISTIDVNAQRDNGSALMTFSIGSESSYILESSENDGIGFSDLSTVFGGSENILGLNTEDNYYCHRIRTFDACNNQFIFSNIICTTQLNVEVGDGFNTVSWDTDTTLVDFYRVLRDGSLLETITNSSVTTYNDSDILCDVEYSYEVQSFFGSARSTSVDTLVTAVKTGDLPALDNPSSTIVDGTVIVSWPSPSDDVPISQFIVERSIGGRSFNQVNFAISTVNEFSDPQSFFRPELSYRIIYEDRCGNQSVPSPVTNPIILNIGSISSNVVSFEWSKYETWINGIRTYFLERLDDTGNVIEEFSVLSGRTREVEFSVLDDQPKNIRVRAESLDATPLITYSNIRSVEIDPILYLPTAFTPDEDGLNDAFIVKGPPVFNYKMHIFSRWGDSVFFSENADEGWDGLIGGKKAPEGLYIYKVEFQDAVGRAFEQSGKVILLRQK